MPNIPLPFVVALLLAVLAVRLAATDGAGLTQRRMAIFLSVCAIEAVNVGLRWSFDLRASRPIIAAAFAPAAWVCFAGPAQGVPQVRWRDGLHALPVLVIALLDWVWWQPVDFLLAAMFIGYGLALLRLAQGGPDRLASAALADVGLLHRGLWIAGSSLLISAAVEIAVASSFLFDAGRQAPSIVIAVQVLTLLAVAVGIVVWRVRPAAISSAAADPSGDATIVAQIEAAMLAKRLYRDPELTLDRLARRVGIPARQISGALNRARDRNVSQVVNDYRIAEAQLKLRDGDAPVTQIMLDCGFQTKSNFNREFRRVTGTSPSDYRRAGSARKLATTSIT